MIIRRVFQFIFRIVIYSFLQAFVTYSMAGIRATYEFARFSDQISVPSAIEKIASTLHFVLCYPTCLIWINDSRNNPSTYFSRDFYLLNGLIWGISIAVLFWWRTTRSPRSQRGEVAP